MKLQNDSRIFEIITKKDKMLEHTEEISNMLNVSISEIDNTYWFQTCYEEIKDIPEFAACFTDEGKIYNDRLNIYVNYDKQRIEAVTTSDGDTEIDVEIPKMSNALQKMLINKAKEMANLKEFIIKVFDQDERDEV